jgi:hypothetical protein
MKASFTEKAAALIFVALGTTAGIYVSTHLMIGMLGVCK